MSLYHHKYFFVRSIGVPPRGVHFPRDGLSIPFLGETPTDTSTSLFMTATTFTWIGTAVGPAPNDASTPTATVGKTTPAAGTSVPNSDPTSMTAAAVTDTADAQNPTGTWMPPATTATTTDGSETSDQQDQWSSTTNNPTPTSFDSATLSSIPDRMTSAPGTTAISTTSSIFTPSTSANTDAQSIIPSPTAAASRKDQHGISTTTIVEVVAICLACLCALILALLLWRVLRRRRRDSMNFGDPEFGSVPPADMAASTDMDSHIPTLPSDYGTSREDPRWRQMPLAIDTSDIGSDTLQSGYLKHDPSSYDTPTDETAEASSPIRVSSTTSTLSYIDTLCPETARPLPAPSTPLPRYVPQSRPLPVPEGLDSPFASMYSVEDRLSIAAGSVDGHAGDAYSRPMAVYGSVHGQSSLSLDHRASWVTYTEQPPPVYSQY
ncbi:hypothetical protein C8Q73DRAFT_35379 [Cubamyces lactineus]|nr:hypothetical protein C8Q73DRAFT_35379 [Cubamyces lactineus]